MGYATIFKSRRTFSNMSQKEVARKLKCAVMTVSNAERSFEETQHLPSERYIKKFASYFGTSRQDKAELEKKLMFERALLLLPPGVGTLIRHCLTDQNEVKAMGAMPMTFRNMLAEDVKTAQKSRLKSIGKDKLDEVINGTRLLSRDDVILFAEALHQNTEKYLYEAQYFTDGILYFLNASGLGYELGEYITRMSKNEFDLIVKPFVYSLMLLKKP